MMTPQTAPGDQVAAITATCPAWCAESHRDGSDIHRARLSVIGPFRGRPYDEISVRAVDLGTGRGPEVGVYASKFLDHDADVRLWLDPATAAQLAALADALAGATAAQHRALATALRAAALAEGAPGRAA
jgi:hypothetical protein